MNIQVVLNRIEESLKTQTDDAKTGLYKKLDVEVMEKTQYFELNARRFASGKIDLNTSQFIYNKLRDYENTTLPERIVITQLMMELAQKK
jgi:hypothetical protein